MCKLRFSNSGSVARCSGVGMQKLWVFYKDSELGTHVPRLYVQCELCIVQMYSHTFTQCAHMIIGVCERAWRLRVVLALGPESRQCLKLVFISDIY
jgi:hypothetical protein